MSLARSFKAGFEKFSWGFASRQRQVKLSTVANATKLDALRVVPALKDRAKLMRTLRVEGKMFRDPKRKPL